MITESSSRDYFEGLFGLKIPEAKTLEEKEWKAMKLRAFMQTEYHYYLSQFKKECYGPKINLAQEIMYLDYLKECRNMTKEDVMSEYAINFNLNIKIEKNLPKNMLELLQAKSQNLNDKVASARFSEIRIKKTTSINDWYLYGFYKVSKI